jgi:hypothetical protein
VYCTGEEESRDATFVLGIPLFTTITDGQVRPEHTARRIIEKLSLPD